MLDFDPQDPFPLLPADSHTYAEAQRHAALADDWLGLRTEEIERALVADPREELRAGHTLWIGLPVRSLLTPYTEIRELLARLGPAPGERLVDLGAGYGRMGFVAGRHFPEVHFTGYEFVAERVRESARCLAKFGFPAVRMLQADLSAGEFSPVPAEIYFIYDYGTREAIEKTLWDLRGVARARPIRVVGRGRASRDAIERSHPWLSQVVPPEHFAHYSIYRSA